MLFLSVSLGFKDETEQKIRCEENLLSNFYDFFASTSNIEHQIWNAKKLLFYLTMRSEKKKKDIITTTSLSCEILKYILLNSFLSSCTSQKLFQMRCGRVMA